MLVPTIKSLFRFSMFFSFFFTVLQNRTIFRSWEASGSSTAPGYRWRRRKVISLSGSTWITSAASKCRTPSRRTWWSRPSTAKMVRGQSDAEWVLGICKKRLQNSRQQHSSSKSNPVAKSWVKAVNNSITLLYFIFITSGHYLVKTPCEKHA